MEIIKRTQPNALLGTALNRNVVIEGLVAKWGGEIEASGAMTKADLTTALKGLRADYLLSASTATSASALLDILATAVIGPPGAERTNLKVVGSSTSDLVFTPVSPCRIVDTRLVGGPWVPGVERSYVGYTAGDFSAQGGASMSNCGIPSGVAALAVEAIAYLPPADGWFYLWPSNIAHPATSTFNYGPALSVISFGTILPVDGASNNGFKADSSQATYLILDVVGYFETTFLAAATVTQTTQTSVSIGPGAFVSVDSPACPAGRIMVSGNCANNASGDVLLSDAKILGTGWRCWYHNSSGSITYTVYSYANCMTTPAVK